MEKLLKEISKFARANREALKLAEQWLNEDEFDDLGEAWDTAINELPRDWRKIVFIGWLASDEKLDDCKFEIDGFDPHVWLSEQIYFLVSVIFPGSYSTKEHPNVGRIRGALKKGIQFVSENRNKGRGRTVDPDRIKVIKKIEQFDFRQTSPKNKWVHFVDNYKFPYDGKKGQRGTLLKLFLKRHYPKLYDRIINW